MYSTFNEEIYPNWNKVSKMGLTDQIFSNSKFFSSKYILDWHRNILFILSMFRVKQFCGMFQFIDPVLLK